MKTIVLENIEDIDPWVGKYLQKYEFGEVEIVNRLSSKTDLEMKEVFQKILASDNLVVGSTFGNMEQLSRFILTLNKYEKLPNIYLIYTFKDLDQFLNLKLTKYLPEIFEHLISLINKTNVYDVIWNEYEDASDKSGAYFKTEKNGFFYKFDTIKFFYNKSQDLIVHERPIFIELPIHQHQPKIPFFIDRSKRECVELFLQLINTTNQVDLYNCLNECKAMFKYQKESIEDDRDQSEEKVQLLQEKDSGIHLTTELYKIFSKM